MHQRLYARKGKEGDHGSSFAESKDGIISQVLFRKREFLFGRNNDQKLVNPLGSRNYRTGSSSARISLVVGAE